MVDFRVMKPEDEGFFMQLMDMVGWGMTTGDYSRMLTFSPEGLFIASIKGVDLGMVVTVNYGEIAWIGNLVVLPESRGKGIGAALMIKAIEYLTSEGVKAVRLDGVQPAVPLYHRLGFKDEYWSLRYTGVATKHEVSKTRSMTVEDLKTVGDFDESVFKGSRHDVINYTYEKNSELAFTAWDGDELIGYIMAKHGKSNVKIGPWLCKPGYSSQAEELLRSMMNQVVGADLWVGLPEGNKDGVSIIEKHGFTAITSSLRMCYGDCSNVENVESVYGLGGPDKG
jgi:GNAT superfamily N-acetyltransferase